MSLDCSQPWIIYWSLNSLDLINNPALQYYPSAIEYLKKCEYPNGGYGGGPYQVLFFIYIVITCSCYICCYLCIMYCW